MGVEKMHYSIFEGNLLKAIETFSRYKGSQNDDAKSILDILYYVGELNYHVESLKNTNYYVDVKGKYFEWINDIISLDKKQSFIILKHIENGLSVKISKLEEILTIFINTYSKESFAPESEEFDWFLNLRDQIEYILMGLNLLHKDISNYNTEKRLLIFDEKMRNNILDIAHIYVKKNDYQFYLPHPKRFWWYPYIFSNLGP